MANVINPGTFHPRRVNQYVKSMQYAADVNYGGGTRVSFGAVQGALGNNVVNAQSVVAAVTLDLTTLGDIAAPFGRNVQVIGSANIVAGSAITLTGWDYLGQPMTEAFTSVAGVTPILGNKAFKTFRNVTFALNTGTAPVTFSIGQGLKLGLPYRAIGARLETFGGNPSATQGTFVAGSFQVQSNAVGFADPRGTYTPFSTPNGSAVITAIFDFTNDFFGAPGGAFPNDGCGLYGFPHLG